MANRRGRPALPDETVLRQVAEHMVVQEEHGKHCSARAAILRTSDGRVTAHSREADLWRLQRKWRLHGDRLLAEVRERRSRARRRELAGIAHWSGLGSSTLADLVKMAGMGGDAIRAFQAQQEEVASALRAMDEIRRHFSIQDEIRRHFSIQDEIRRHFSIQDEIRRPNR